MRNFDSASAVADESAVGNLAAITALCIRYEKVV
jgi:hypothetical protein